MPEPQQFTFQIEGPEATTVAAELREVLAREFEDWPVREAAAEPPTEPDPCKVTDPVALAAMILAIPPTVLAMWDLGTRLKMKEKAERLLAWATQHRSRGGGRILWGHGATSIPLDEARVDEIVNALQGMADRSRATNAP